MLSEVTAYQYQYHLKTVQAHRKTLTASTVAASLDIFRHFHFGNTQISILCYSGFIRTVFMDIRDLSSDHVWDYENGFHCPQMSRMGKQLAHYDIYKNTVPGDILELGVYKGLL